MAIVANGPVNKVVVSGEIVVDLSKDTVTSSTLLEGSQAHDKSGAKIQGSIKERSQTDLVGTIDRITIPAGYYPDGAVVYCKEWQWDPFNFQRDLVIPRLSTDT